jgi:hypothetical protein
MPVLLAVVVVAMQDGRRRSLEAGRKNSTVMEQPAELERKGRAVMRRLERKERLAQAVLEGRLTLLEAAALFRTLDEGPPGFNWEQFRRSHAGDSDEERHCREVIKCVCPYPPEEAPRCREEARRRLGADLAEHLDHGTLRLPEVDALLGFLDDGPD